MKILIDDDYLEFSSFELLKMRLGSGFEAVVYGYNDEALKIYRMCSIKLRLDEEDAIRLSKLSATRRVLLPQRIIRDPDTLKFKGYTTKLLPKEEPLGIFNMQMRQFLSEISLIRDDVVELANQGVKVTDFNIENTVYKGGIYLVDPGSFQVRREKTTRYLRDEFVRWNMINLNWFIKNSFVRGVRLGCCFEDIFSDVPGKKVTCIGDIIEKDAKCDETLGQYVKRMSRVK